MNTLFRAESKDGLTVEMMHNIHEVILIDGAVSDENKVASTFCVIKQFIDEIYKPLPFDKSLEERAGELFPVRMRAFPDKDRTLYDENILARKAAIQLAQEATAGMREEIEQLKKEIAFLHKYKNR